MTRAQLLKRRLRQIEANHGVFVAVVCLPLVLWHIYVNAPAAAADWPDPTGIAFDRKYGVSTCGIIPVAELGAEAPNWVYGHDYQAVEVFDMQALLAEFRIDYSNTVFIDLGAGKGRVVMFASELPFKRLIGVEMSAELADIARNNLAIFAAARRDGRERTIMQDDAARFPLPQEPLVVFMYNPFSVPVMQAVIHNLTASARARPRRILVIYFRPELSEMWTFAPGFRLVGAGERYRIYEHDPDRTSA